VINSPSTTDSGSRTSPGPLRMVSYLNRRFRVLERAPADQQHAAAGHALVAGERLVEESNRSSCNGTSADESMYRCEPHQYCGTAVRGNVPTPPGRAWTVHVAPRHQGQKSRGSAGSSAALPCRASRDQVHARMMSAMCGPMHLGVRGAASPWRHARFVSFTSARRSRPHRCPEEVWVEHVSAARHN